MCLICVEWIKRPMSVNEAARNSRELNDGSKHAHSVENMIDCLKVHVDSLDRPIKPKSISVTDNGACVDLSDDNSF